MNKGFSLVELIVVIAIMAILVGVAVPVYTQYIGKANNGVDAQLVEEIDRALETALIECKADKSLKMIEEESTDTKITIKFTTNAEPAFTGEKEETTKDFIAAVKKIIDTSKVNFKGDFYKNGVTFEIDVDKCTAKVINPVPTPAA